MEEPLCFVRDNPFFKADGGCRRLIRRAPVQPRGIGGPPAVLPKEKLEMGAEAAEYQPAPTSPDLEYGPGIVEKLKAKFSKLSGLTTKEPKRRSPSLDELNNHHDYEPVGRHPEPQLLRRHSKSSSDILAEDARAYTIHREIRLEPEEDPLDVPSISTLRRKFEPNDRSRSLSRSRPVSADFSHYQNISLTPSYEPPTRTICLSPEVEIPPQITSPPPLQALSPPFTSAIIEHSPPIQREIPKEREIPPAPVVPALSREVETRRLRVLEVLNHVDDEPEFVKIGRSLRKSKAPPSDLFESSHDESLVLRRVEDDQFKRKEAVTKEIVYHENNNYYESPLPIRQEIAHPKTEPPRAPPPRKFIIRGEAHLPTLSNNFKIIRETPYVDNPPDPEPKRRSSIEHRPPSPIQPAHIASAPQGSPPPEEPRPSVKPPSQSEEPCRLCEEAKVKEVKSEEAANEIQRLLTKFQISRNNRGVYEVSREEAFSPPPVTREDNRQFSATVVGVHNSARQATASGRVNVVSISVSARSDAPSVISTNKTHSPDVSPISTVSATKRPAPSPPEIAPLPPQPQPFLPQSAPPPLNEERKSLSSRYFEDKARREKPYGDDVTELRTELRESSVDDDTDIFDRHIEASLQDSSESEEDDDDDILARPYKLRIPEPIIAGDGNIVRHTLFSLVMEEDIPQLIEAMNEKFHFIFEDLHDRPSTSSIIHPLETRKMRRQQRQVSSIKFQEENPMVYTYLEEEAQVSEQWKEGACLEYNEYQRLWEEDFREKELGIIELERWKAEVAMRMVEREDIPSAFNSNADPNTMCSRAPAVA